MTGLQGKTALVTGSTRGIGRVIAGRLAEAGANVVIHGRHAADVARTIGELEPAGITLAGFTADLSHHQEAHALAEQVLAAVPQLDILVNNAGASVKASFWDVRDESWEAQTNVNYRSPFILAQHAARHMRERGIAGRIVNTSTIGAHVCHGRTLVYDASKAAVEAMTRNMAWELGPDGITVNCVVPGPIGDRPGDSIDSALWQGIKPFVPVGRVGSGADIAAAVLFFCQPEAAFITGQSLQVDGGYAMGLPENYFEFSTPTE
ncbi:MAG: SDR family oxidoreductase [Thermomicrobiales bacterium]|nr:SDR family oxidoreductase [Thermomicrobiales bacterium]